MKTGKQKDLISSIAIRAINKSETGSLNELLYQAIYQPDEQNQQKRINNENKI